MGRRVERRMERKIKICMKKYRRTGSVIWKKNEV